MKTGSILLVLACVLFTQTALAAPEKKSKKETIVVEGKLGVIKEERVKSVQSTVTYSPAGGGSGYSLIGISDAATDGLNQHVESDPVAIPSWTLFSW